MAFSNNKSPHEGAKMISNSWFKRKKPNYADSYMEFDAASWSRGWCFRGDRPHGCSSFHAERRGENRRQCDSKRPLLLLRWCSRFGTYTQVNCDCRLVTRSGASFLGVCASDLRKLLIIVVISVFWESLDVHKVISKKIVKLLIFLLF